MRSLVVLFIALFAVLGGYSATTLADDFSVSSGNQASALKSTDSKQSTESKNDTRTSNDNNNGSTISTKDLYDHSRYGGSTPYDVQTSHVK